VLPHAHPLPGAKAQIGIIHGPQSLRKFGFTLGAAAQPSLRAEVVRVRAPYGFVAVDDPGVEGQDCALGDDALTGKGMMVGGGRWQALPARWYVALQPERHAREVADGLADDGFEVGHATCLFVAHGRGFFWMRRGEAGGGELGPQTCPHAGRAQAVVQRGSDGDGGGVGAGGHVGHYLGDDLAVGNGWVGGLDFEEVV